MAGARAHNEYSRRHGLFRRGLSILRSEGGRHVRGAGLFVVRAPSRTPFAFRIPHYGVAEKICVICASVPCVSRLLPVFWNWEGTKTYENWESL